MAIEIERKFLVLENTWQNKALPGVRCLQGYLLESDHLLIRVRLYDQQGFLAVKARKSGFSRFEYEYEIPSGEAEEMLVALCLQPLIEKTRYELIYEGHCWEIDVFSGLNQGLVVAEIELTHEEETFIKPPWAGLEVTHDPRYLNVNLVKCPYRTWPSFD